MSKDLYYTAPDDSIFEDILAKAIMIWSSYDNAHGYATEKISQIKDIKNVDDNYMYIVAMFDADNQAKLLDMVKPETAERINAALV